MCGLAVRCSGVGSKAFFFEKRSKNFFPFGSAHADARPRYGMQAQAQKFFASFFKTEGLFAQDNSSNATIPRRCVTPPVSDVTGISSRSPGTDRFVPSAISTA